MEKQNEFLTIDEAVKYCKISESTIHRARKAGIIHACKPNGFNHSRVFFRKNELNRWLSGELNQEQVNKGE